MVNFWLVNNAILTNLPKAMVNRVSFAVMGFAVVPAAWQAFGTVRNFAEGLDFTAAWQDSNRASVSKRGME